MCFSALLLSLVALHTWCFALLSHIVISSYYFPSLIVSCFDFLGLLFLPFTPSKNIYANLGMANFTFSFPSFVKISPFIFFKKKTFLLGKFSHFLYMFCLLSLHCWFFLIIYIIYIMKKIVHTYIGYTSKKFVFLKCS